MSYPYLSLLRLCVPCDGRVFTPLGCSGLPHTHLRFTGPSLLVLWYIVWENTYADQKSLLEDCSHFLRRQLWKAERCCGWWNSFFWLFWDDGKIEDVLLTRCTRTQTAGIFNTIVGPMKLFDDMHFRYFCMSAQRFYNVLTTMSCFIHGLCRDIWHVLKEEFSSTTRERWFKILRDFCRAWHFPNRFGCIDGVRVHQITAECWEQLLYYKGLIGCLWYTISSP